MPATDIGTSDDLLTELSQWVKIETPTPDGAAVNRLMDVAEADLARAGAAMTRIPGRNGFGDLLVARTPIAHAGGSGKPVLLAGHLDTVWSHGTLESMPYTVNGAKAHGPGIYDMKAGSFLVFHVLRSILLQRIATPRPIVLLLTSDEEVGSPTSRWLIEQEAARAAAVLIPEPAGAGGACVTARKGVGRFVMQVEGRGSHAGGAFEDGASAIVELSHQIIALHRMVDTDRGITLNTAPVWGGSRPNVIAPDDGCEIDLRVNSAADGEAMEARLLGLTAKTPGCRISVQGGMNRPTVPGNPCDLEALRACAGGCPAGWAGAAEAAPRRRIGRQLRRGHRGADPGRAGLPGRRSARQPRAHPVGTSGAARGAAGRAAGNARLIL